MQVHPGARLAAAALTALVLAACDAPRTALAPGSSAGSSAPLAEAQARAAAGEGCPATTQGTARLVTRGEGPVVLHGGTPSGTASRSGTREAVPASGLTGSGCE